MSTRRLQNRCEECDASCKECTAPGKGTNCTDCYHGFVLFKGVCLSGMCGTGFYQDQQKVRAIRRFRSSLIQDKIHIWNAQDVLALKGVGVGWRTIWLTDKKNCHYLSTSPQNIPPCYDREFAPNATHPAWRAKGRVLEIAWLVDRVLSPCIVPPRNASPAASPTPTTTMLVVSARTKGRKVRREWAGYLGCEFAESHF